MTKIRYEYEVVKGYRNGDTVWNVVEYKDDVCQDTIMTYYDYEQAMSFASRMTRTEQNGDIDRWEDEGGPVRDYAESNTLFG